MSQKPEVRDRGPEVRDRYRKRVESKIPVARHLSAVRNDVIFKYLPVRIRSSITGRGLRFTGGFFTRLRFRGRILNDGLREITYAPNGTEVPCYR